MKPPLLRRATQLGLVATLGLAATLATSGPAGAVSSPTAFVVGRTLNIIGTSGPDDITVSIASATSTTLLVDLDHDGIIDQQFDRSAVDALNVSLGSGNDHFSANGVPMAQTSTIDGGSGDDTIVGTAGNDLIIGGSGVDDLTGGSGDDTIVGGSGADITAGGLGHDTADLGSGDDNFRWNQGDGSDDVNGGSGNDTLLFIGANIAEQSNLSASGPRAVFTRVQGSIVMNLDVVEHLDLRPLGGADTVTVNDVTGTALTKADIDLSLAGNGGASDGAADVVIVNGTNADDHVNVAAQGAQAVVSGLQPQTRITGANTSDPDELQVKTRDGNDTVNVDPAVAALIGVTTDLGPGQL
jgi:Ca2+-binding RTX toxin-like protein